LQAAVLEAAQFEEKLFGEPTIIGIAYGSIKSADSSVKNEKSTKLYFKQSLNIWISISTHLQHIWDTGGVNGRYTLLGLRVNFSF
jgi:hypothetical protein